MDINHTVFYTTRNSMGRTVYEFSPCFRVMESISELAFLNARFDPLEECKRQASHEFWKCFYGDINEKLTELIKNIYPLPSPREQLIQEAISLREYIQQKRISPENFEYVESSHLEEMEKAVRDLEKREAYLTFELFQSRKELQTARQEAAHWKAICRNRINAKRRKNNRKKQKCGGVK